LHRPTTLLTSLTIGGALWKTLPPSIIHIQHLNDSIWQDILRSVTIQWNVIRIYLLVELANVNSIYYRKKGITNSITLHIYTPNYYLFPNLLSSHSDSENSVSTLTAIVFSYEKPFNRKVHSLHINATKTSLALFDWKTASGEI
jgi:hypothetical protein